MQNFKETFLKRLEDIADKNATDAVRSAHYSVDDSEEYPAIPTQAATIVDLFERGMSFFKSQNPKAFAILDIGSGIGSALLILHKCGLSTGATHVKLYGIEKS